MIFKWEPGSEISAGIEKGKTVIRGNRAGLLSLANHLRALAEEEGPSHFHLDPYNSLEEGSAELIIEKLQDPE